tara:strand:+ start:1541 stop:2530 length:990 start_codon:yes stop_codon:yes gene_type:complete
MKFLFENWRKFINEQTSGEDLVYQGEIEPMPEMAEKFKKERKEIYDSYESGVNKKAFVAPNGLLRRRLFPNAPQRVIEAYYNWHVLPQIQKAIFTVPVVNVDDAPKEMRAAKQNIGVHYHQGVVWDTNWFGMGSNTFKHEMGHAIDHGVELTSGAKEKEFIKHLNPDLPDHENPLSDLYMGQTLAGWNQDVLKKLFPKSPYYSLPENPYESGYYEKWRKFSKEQEARAGQNYIEPGTHHERPSEFYDSIVIQRQDQGREYTPEDVGDMKSSWQKFWIPPGVIDHDVINAVDKLSDEGMTDKEISDLLNQVAVVEEPKPLDISNETGIAE